MRLRLKKSELEFLQWAVEVAVDEMWTDEEKNRNSEYQNVIGKINKLLAPIYASRKR